jgi:predicted ATPase
MSVSISVQYAARIAAGVIERDVAQEAIVRNLAALEKELADRRLARKSSSLGWLFGSRARALQPIKGRYIFGDVGRGKTMLMDMFFDASPVMRKRRVHFHEFMAEVHERIHLLRQQHVSHFGTFANSRSPVPIISRSHTSFTPSCSIKFQSWIMRAATKPSASSSSSTRSTTTR